MYAILNILFGFICSIGLYRLFYSINRPTAKMRSVLQLILCIVMMPGLLLLGRFLAGYDEFVLPKLITLLTYIYEILALLFIVLLSAHRRQALVCAAFVFCMINMIELPLIFFIGTIIQPTMNMTQFMNEIMFKIPAFFSVYVFFYNIILMGSCFLAAHWLQKTKENPPLYMANLFSIIFTLIVIIHYVWSRDILKIMTASFFPSALLGIFFVVIVPILFYFFTRFTAEKEISNQNKEIANPVYELKNENVYIQFTQNLSKREIDVVNAILDGNVSHKDLAAALNISINTVKTHLQHIYHTTGVSNIISLISHLNSKPVSKQ